MTPRSRQRLRLVLVLLLFAIPLLAAIVLHALDWRPPGTRNHGELIEPPRDLTHARFLLEDGTPLAWRDADWSWTVFAIAGPDCAQACLARIDELRRVRVSLNENAPRVRVLVVGTTLPAAMRAALSPVAMVDDADARLADLRPSAGELAAALADPHGFLVMHYAPGYDASGLRKDLSRLVKQ